MQGSLCERDMRIVSAFLAWTTSGPDQGRWSGAAVSAVQFAG